MTDEIIVDASALVALFDDSDLWHNATVELLTECAKHNLSVIILDVIVNETVSVLIRRFHNKKKTDKLADCFNKIHEFVTKKKIRLTSSIARNNFRPILDLILKSNSVLSFNDALIVFYCEKAGASHIFSFDTDFDAVPSIKRIYSPEQLQQV